MLSDVKLKCLNEDDAVLQALNTLRDAAQHDPAFFDDLIELAAEGV